MGEECESTPRLMAAGALARVSSAVLLMPLDTVKTRMQFDGSGMAHHTPYTTIGTTITRITRAEGFGALYRGILPRLVYITPAAAVSFTVYEHVKRSLQHQEGALHPGLPLMGAVAARVLATAIRTPFDVVKQRLQVDGVLRPHSPRSALSLTRDIVRTDGIRRGLWVGYRVALLRDAPFAVLYFSTYESLKALQQRVAGSVFAQWYGGEEGETRRLGVLNHLVAGAGAGVVASTFTIPIDVVKTRLQTAESVAGSRDTVVKAAPNGPKPHPPPHTPHSTPTTTPPPPLPPSTFRHTFTAIWRAEGVRGLTRGLRARLVYIAPAGALTFAFYEQYKRLLAPDCDVQSFPPFE